MINIANDSIALLVMLCTLCSAVYARRQFRGHRSFFPAMLGAAVGMDASTLLAWIAQALGRLRLFAALFSVGSVFYFAVLALFICGIQEYLVQRGVMLRWPICTTVPVCALSALAWICSGKNGMFYTFGPTGSIAPGPYHLLGQLGGFWVLGVLLIVVLRYRAVLGRRVAVVFAAFPILPLLSPVLQQLLPGTHLMPLLLSAALLRVYAYILREQSQALHARRIRLAQDRVDISFRQIRPHFLYNTLSSIYYLCDADPQAAQAAIDDLTAYLRCNLESMEQEVEIPLRRELEHVQHYLRLEQMRFGDDLRVEYDIAAVDFSVPALTIQPLVENAVKHGLMPREGGGTVVIRSRQQKDGYTVTVADDGVGFDPAALPQDGHVHIGIRNVRERLRDVCRGELTIRSAPGKGATAVILIPKNSRKSSRCV